MVNYFCDVHVAQLDRVSDSDSEGWWFDSTRVHHFFILKLLKIHYLHFFLNYLQ